MQKFDPIQVGIQTIKVVRIVLVVSLVLCFYFSPVVIAQELFLNTGFEKDTIGKPPNDWEVVGKGFEITRDPVKTDKNALAILLGANDERINFPIETENPIITVEFWVYIEGGGRSFNFKVITSDNHAQNAGGPYVNWDANGVRLFDGGAWQPIDEFKTDEWRYVRIVTDVSKSEFIFYSGNDRPHALKDKGKKNLPFRNAAIGPVPLWVSFHVYSITAPGYVDDLLIYEGDEPINLAVVPNEKLTTAWGYIKKR
ncbi:hypothetical protein JT359_08370 [Candidatus Poribacteria bacterium]|nr:hypothetical protein [Candidatus Poribacteria bacterium]